MTKIIKINSFYLETVLRSPFASVLIIYMVYFGWRIAQSLKQMYNFGVC